MSAHPGYYDHPSCPTPHYKKNRMLEFPKKNICRIKYRDRTTPKGTKTNHTVDNRIPKILEGHRKEVFHPPKNRMSKGLR